MWELAYRIYVLVGYAGLRFLSSLKLNKDCYQRMKLVLNKIQEATIWEFNNLHQVKKKYKTCVRSFFKITSI